MWQISDRDTTAEGVYFTTNAFFSFAPQRGEGLRVRGVTASRDLMSMESYFTTSAQLTPRFSRDIQDRRDSTI
jgi:hypothetical protein